MSSEEREEHGGSLLGGLLSPLRLPERVIRALESLVEAAQEVAPMRSELTRVREQTEPLPALKPLLERIDKQTEQLAELLPVVEDIREQAKPLAELLPALKHVEDALGTRIESLGEVVGDLEGKDSHLNKTVGEIVGELGEMQETLRALQDEVKSVTDHLPDSRGPLQKAKEVFTSDDD